MKTVSVSQQWKILSNTRKQQCSTT